MPKLFSSDKIYVAQSKIVPKERGVFAKAFIKKGTIIEVCPILSISTHDTAEISEESLVTYMFYFGKKKEKSLIALGFGSLYNHSPKNNAIYQIEPKEKIITFIAAKDIKKDEEIAINYSGNNEKLPLWFVE